jgi:hypothetical protein
LGFHLCDSEDLPFIRALISSDKELVDRLQGSVIITYSISSMRVEARKIKRSVAKFFPESLVKLPAEV